MNDMILSEQVLLFGVNYKRTSNESNMFKKIILKEITKTDCLQYNISTGSTYLWSSLIHAAHTNLFLVSLNGGHISTLQKYTKGVSNIGLAEAC